MGPLWIILALVAGAGIATVVFYFLSNKSGVNGEEAMDKKISDIRDKFIEHLSRELASLRQEVNSNLKENRETLQKSTQGMNQSVFSFTKEIGTMASGLMQVQNEVKKISSFQDIFKTPKLRGKWGEASLEHLLAQYFPQELYKRQHQFSTGEAVDAIIYLPNDKILSIDAKFPSDNFMKMIETSDELEKMAFRKIFIQDVKTKIDDINKKYILPQEGTIDIALMYVPAETVYYELINSIKEADVIGYAWSKKVVICSPNTFYLTLGVIQHWFKDIKISKQTKQVIKSLERVNQDAIKLNESFRILGKHIKETSGSFDDSEQRLGLMTGRIQKVIQIGNLEEADQDIKPRLESVTNHQKKA